MLYVIFLVTNIHKLINIPVLAVENKYPFTYTVLPTLKNSPHPSMNCGDLKNQRTTVTKNTKATEISWKDGDPRAWYRTRRTSRAAASRAAESRAADRSESAVLLSGRLRNLKNEKNNKFL